MSTEKQKNSRIFGLDVVRATAILLVVFSHLYYLVDSYNPIFITLSGIAGYAGVEIFFVLSGFLIGSILLRKFIANDFGLSAIVVFLKRRWMRTLPNYYFILILNSVIGLYFGYEMKEIWKYFFFVQNFYTYSITIFPESWSLSVEEWTYLLIPFLLILMGYNSKNKKRTFLLVVLFLILIFHCIRYAFFQYNIIPSMEAWNIRVKSIVIFRIDSILVGFIIAWCHFYYSDQLKKLSPYLFILSAHLFFLQFVAMNVMGYDVISTPKYFIVFYFTLSTVTFAFFLPVFIYWNSEKSVLAKMVTYISKWSYSMYLIHYSVLTILIKYFRDNFFSDIPVYFTLFFYFVLLFLGSFCLHKFIEKPIMNLRDK